MLEVDAQPSFADAREVCDIVMKGGITSGVVYPLAVVSLARKYRFAAIGGTSAGAIAAAAAAAAEYGRFSLHGGFARLEKVPAEIGSGLLALFQPAPKVRPLFDIFIALLKGKSGPGKVSRAFGAAVLGYRSDALLGSCFGFFLALVVAGNGSCGPRSTIFFASVFAIAGVVIAILRRILISIQSDLPENDFGLCPGVRQPGFESEGLTDWLTRLIDEAAGRDADGAPLTFGDLEAAPGHDAPILLAMMTTSLMERRPYTLPFRDEKPSRGMPNGFIFERGEWERLFPKRVVEYLLRVCAPYHPMEGEKGDFYKFPDTAHLPVVVAARMSLSFPGLICAVPLWRKDQQFQEPHEKNRLRRCLFSDGGLSSNFPIHFFDSLLPNRPTFAISLDEYDARRSKDGDNVWMPGPARSGHLLPIIPIEGVGGFLMRLLDSAKDWQDNLQSVLPGYRERIVHIGLNPNEGGLNLTMDKGLIDTLAGVGQRAGEKLCIDFRMDAHRWRRFLVAMARVEETLDEVASAYAGGPHSLESFQSFLKRYPGVATEYRQGKKQAAAMLSRGEVLSKLGLDWRSEPTIRRGRIPKPETNLRITPKP